MKTILGALLSLGLIGFAIFWTATALAAGAPASFAVFGVLFIVVAVVTAIGGVVGFTSKHMMIQDQFHRITKKMNQLNRRDPELYDEYEYTEEPKASPDEQGFVAPSGGFCPYCGTRLENDYQFCPHCGRQQ